MGADVPGRHNTAGAFCIVCDEGLDYGDCDDDDGDGDMKSRGMGEDDDDDDDGDDDGT